jgi:error-prone DNA polymerase
MAARFADHPEAVAETARLAETLTFDLRSDLGYSYPGAENPEAAAELASVCWHAFGRRYPRGHPLHGEAHGRLQEELRVISQLRLPGFFLLHREILELAREVAVEVRGGAAARSLLPPGRGRGSSVSSIVCYLIGLSHVDPIANDLLLGRFLSEDLEALPDIDLDFPRDIREVLIPRVHAHYGRDRAALVAAFPTFRTRGAIREIGKALGLPPGEIERVARGSDAWGGASVDKDIAIALGEDRHAGRWKWLGKLAIEAYGLPRHLSQHSGGMIVSTQPLVDCCPVVPAAMEGRQMVMWDKDSCSDARFLKIDLLGLGMLSAVERTVELIAARRGERVDLSRIPYDDEATFDSIKAGETTGVFQIESRAQMGSLRRTRPETLEELTIQVAIVRPGPIVGGAVNPYIERLQRKRVDPSFEVPYEHPSLEPVLRETLGTIIFQDQVIEAARAFAGFAPGAAEGLRRAMSRKRSDEAIRAFHDRFVEGAMTRHADVDEALAERVWTMIVGFSGFGFPKAHGAAFGLLAYQSAWLREHYGPEFLCALLDEQPMGFYPPDALTHEAQRRGIPVLAPDVNLSGVGCAVVDRVPPDRSLVSEAPAGAVRLGLGYVLGVRAEEVTALVAAREAGGPFRSLEDLASRAGAGRPALEQLAWSGACDSLVGAGVPAGAARRTALWRLGVAAPPRRAGEEGTQLALPLELPAPPVLRPLERWASMLADYATTTVSTGDHPLGLLRAELRGGGAASSGELQRLAHGSAVRIGGLVVARQRPGTAKGVTFLLLEDEEGTINLIIPPRIYARDRLAVRTEPLVLAHGRLERHASAGGAINVVVDRLVSLASPGREEATVTELGRERVPGRAPDAVPVEELAPTGTGDFRAVAPAVMSFAQGRRR